MTHDEFGQLIRERYADLFDTALTDQEWQIYLITIGPGWQGLVEVYCKKAQPILRENGEVGRWYIRQIKEKMGELRIYHRPAPYERLDIDPPHPTPVQKLLSDLRAQIVERAHRTCEECGEPGGLRVIDGWYRTVCDHHFQEWKERKHHG